MAAVTIVVVLAILIYLITSVSKWTTVPGPKGLPIVGSFFLLWPYARKEQTYKFAEKMFAKYGPMYSFSIFGRKQIMTKDADTAKRLLNGTAGGEIADAEFVRSPELQQMHKGLIHYGLFMIPSGAVWKRHRKPAFGPSHLRLAQDVSAEMANVLVDVWKEMILKAGQDYIRVDVYEAFSAVTLDVIGKVAFSYEFNSIRSLNDPSKVKDFHLINEVFSFVIRRFMFPSFLWNSMGMGVQHAAKSMTYINAILQDVLQKKRTRLQSEGQLKDRWDLDVLDRLLAGGEEFTDAEIKDELFAFFLAGHETTANSLTFAILELCRFPRVLAKLEKEIFDVLGKDGRLTQDNLPQLKYAEQVVKETLRLDPVVSGIPRQTARKLDILGHSIPAGVGVIAAVRAIHRDERYWESPLEFRPERWDNGFVPQAGTYLPFGAGPMNCIGQKLALLEARIAMVELMRNFNLTLVPGQDLEPRSSITTGLKDGLLIDVRRK